MSRFDIWRESPGRGSASSEAPVCLARDVEGESFLEAVTRWYASLEHPENWGDLSIKDGQAYLWGKRLFPINQ